MRVKIEKMGINGEGIGYLNKKPIFVDGAIVGEEVDVKITQKFPKYAKAEVIRIIKKSKYRKDKECRFANKCGACSFMHVDYEKQLEYKQEVLNQTLYKYAGIRQEQIDKIVSNDDVFGYRNSFKIPLAMHKGQLVSGFYMPNTNYFVEADKCKIHEEGLENIKKQLLKIFNAYHLTAFDNKTKKGLRTLVVRGFDGQYQCTIVSGKDPLPEKCIEECMNIKGMVSLWQSYHTSKKSVETFGKVMIHLGGTRFLPFTFGGLKLTLSPKSFFQLNTKQAEKLYRIAASMVKDNNEFVVEAYSGIGAISLFVKDKAKEILGIEYISDAVSNANQNAKRNHANHVRFVCGDAAEKLVQCSKKRKINTLIVDPPRSGLDENMLECILRSKIDNIVYISCNPATLGKNLSVLMNKYKVEKIVPVDMFSNTALVETVVMLSHKKAKGISR